MKNPYVKFAFCIFLLGQFFTGCIPSFNRERRPEPVEFTISEKSPFTKENDFKLSIDSLNNCLYIKLTTKALASFQFPKDKQGHLLSGTALNFIFLSHGKPIEGADLCKPNPDLSYFGYNKCLAKNICYNSDTFNLQKHEQIEFKIPLYAFSKLKTGEHELELQCSQNIFCSASTFSIGIVDTMYGDTMKRYIRNYAKVSLLSFKAKFKINMPPVFKTKLYGYGIELRNDSVFSPAGMDNTIWNSSYPDVYWTINYPEQDSYCSSDYQKSTSHYDVKDTFCLFHYSPNDSISIGVWDHDNLTRDDYIAHKRFSINQFQQNKIARFAFDNVKEFQLQIVREGLINK